MSSEVKAACASDPSPRIKVMVKVVGPTQDQKYNIAELSKRWNITERPGMERYIYTFGVADADLNGKAKLNVQTIGDESHWCGKVTDASILINWPIDVHIASEFVPGSCVYRSVLEHEYLHVALDQKLLPELERRLEKGFRELFSKTFWGSSETAVTGAMHDQGDKVIQEILAAFQEERDARQLEIDTPEEYDRVDALCSADEWRAMLPK